MQTYILTLVLLLMSIIIVFLLVKVIDKSKIINLKNEKLSDNFIQINFLKGSIDEYYCKLIDARFEKSTFENKLKEKSQRITELIERIDQLTTEIDEKKDKKNN